MKTYTKLIMMGVFCLIFIGIGTFSTSAETLMIHTSNDLSVGSTGQSVTQLQGILSELGYLVMPINTSPGYFGTLTKNALIKYQRELGVPATGYFGPMTKSALYTQFISRNWMNTSGEFGMMTAGNGSGTTNNTSSPTTSSGNSSTTVSTNTTSQSPLTPTGYWLNGSWYTTTPDLNGTTTGITGYWNGGTWNPLNSGTTTGTNY